VKFEHVMKVVLSVVNVIRFHGLNYRHLQTFMSEIDDDCGNVLYLTEVRWLSCETVETIF
jgi:hypothetical protein